MILYKDKRNKTCKITIEGFNTPIIDLTRYQSPLSTKIIKGNRNTTLKELKRRTKKFVVKYAVKVEVHC